MAASIAQEDAQQGSPAATEAVSGAPRRRERVVRAAARTAGVVGIGVCLALIVITLVGRGWAVSRVDELSARIDGGLARGAMLLDDVTSRVAEVTASVAGVADRAGALADQARPTQALVQALLGDVTDLSERYLEARARYAEAREALVGALARLEVVDQLLPGIALPEGPIDALAALDESLQALDARIMEVVQADPAAAPIQAWSRVVAGAAGRVEAALEGVSDRLEAADAGLAATRADVAAAADRVNIALTVAALVGVLLLLYLALLHWVLYRSGRAIARPPASPSAGPRAASASPDRGDDDPSAQV